MWVGGGSIWVIFSHMPCVTAPNWVLRMLKVMWALSSVCQHCNTWQRSAEAFRSANGLTNNRYYRTGNLCSCSKLLGIVCIYWISIGQTVKCDGACLEVWKFHYRNNMRFYILLEIWDHYASCNDKAYGDVSFWDIYLWIGGNLRGKIWVEGTDQHA